VHNGACAGAVAVETTGTVPVVSVPFPDSFNAISGHFETVQNCPDYFKMSGNGIETEP
jgi:hypothetical protein